MFHRDFAIFDSMKQTASNGSTHHLPFHVSCSDSLPATRGHKPVRSPAPATGDRPKSRADANLIHLVNLRAVEIAQADPVEREIANQLRIRLCMRSRPRATPGCGTLPRDPDSRRHT